MNAPKRPNQDALYQALNIYRDAMRPFTLRNLKTLQGLAPEDRFQNEADIDIGDFPHLFRKYWRDAFEHRFDPDRDVRSAIGLITEARNTVAHPGAEDLTTEYAFSRLYEITNILEQINAPEQKQEVEAIRDKLLTSPTPTPEAKPKLPLADLRNTIAHILEHKQHLVEANEATTQQYAVLPILRALGWDDTNLAVMEVIPEHKVENGNVDYALKVDQKPVLFIECKKWNRSLAEKQASQIFRYAFEGGAPIVGLTNGKIWRFYFSWIEGTSMDERAFSDIDIANLERAVSSLEKYLLKSNVASGKAERNARIALEKREKADKPEPSPIPKQTVAPSEFSGEWTVEQIRNLVSEEIRDYYEANFSEERCNVFYKTVAETQTLIKTEDWRLKPKFNKKSCRFWLTDKGVTQVKSVFGIHLQYNPFTLHVRIMKKDAEELKRQCRCEFSSVSKNKSADDIYYHIPDDITELLPVLEFAYKKHTAN